MLQNEKNTRLFYGSMLYYYYVDEKVYVIKKTSDSHY